MCELKPERKLCASNPLERISSNVVRTSPVLPPRQDSVSLK